MGQSLAELKKTILQKAMKGELVELRGQPNSPEGALSANDGCSPSKKKKRSIVTSREGV